MKTTKHLVITGVQGSGKTTIANAIMQTVNHKYTCRLSPSITPVYLASFKALPYLQMILFDGVKDETEIIKLTKNVELFNTEITILFTCQNPCNALKKDDRYNIVEVN